MYSLRNKSRALYPAQPIGQVKHPPLLQGKWFSFRPCPLQEGYNTVDDMIIIVIIISSSTLIKSKPRYQAINLLMPSCSDVVGL